MLELANRLFEDNAILRASTGGFLKRLQERSNRDANANSADIWRELADMGWLAFPIAPDYGGIGGSISDIAVIMEVIGKGLLTEPYKSTALLGAGVVELCGSRRQQKDILPRVCSGDLKISFAYSDHPDDHESTKTVARRTQHGWELSGKKVAVLDYPSSDLTVVSAVASQPEARHGPCLLFLIDTRLLKGKAVCYERIDGGRAANLTFEGLLVKEEGLLGDSSDKAKQIATTVDRTCLASCYEAIGAMDALLEVTARYTTERMQFGRTLSSNQVIRHRLARMAVNCEASRAIVRRAALFIESDHDRRAQAVSGAKAKVGECARTISEEAIQLHGAIGLTDELNVGKYFKRLLGFQIQYGSQVFHLRRYASLQEPSKHD